MKRSFSRTSVRAMAGAMILALALPAFTAAAHHPTQAKKTPTWLVWNSKTHTATLTLIAAYSNDLSGYNFNGYDKGKMTISVPSGTKVNVVFSNNAPLPHSAVFTPYSKMTSSKVPVAFKGAESPNPTSGLVKGKTQKFSFVANKVGKYALVCAVPGHELIGMWDTFMVTKGGKASISFKK